MRLESILRVIGQNGGAGPWIGIPVECPACGAQTIRVQGISGAVVAPVCALCGRHGTPFEVQVGISFAVRPLGNIARQ